MNKMILSSLLITAALTASAQTVVVTPQNIDEWSVVGVDVEALAREAKLSLPAGAQIDRTFGPGIVILRTVSHPAFLSTVKEQPIMGVGPTSVVFEGNSVVGRFLLIVGDSTLAQLPWTVLGKDDNQGVELTLAYNSCSGVGLVGSQGQWEAFSASSSSDSVEVWLAAGARHAWPLESVGVDVVSEDQLTVTAGPAAAAVDAAASPGLRELLQKLRESSNAGTSSPERPDQADGFGASANAEVPDFAPRRVIGLEIFTPPSVRQRGRSADHAHNHDNQ